ncbi:MAG: polysaccharide deacetylase family protein, partial [Microthrixaceae bacterium]|nr:polysaccharide deacetylase family protein [Microthrixaceae bacterium]
GTFYVPTGRIGAAGFLSWSDVATLAAQGHEIGGHTVDHPNLVNIPSSHATAQVCNDRQNLVAKGYSPTTFAYPFGSNNASVESIVAGCGYTAARDVGGLKAASSCGGCPLSQAVPPSNPMALRTNGSVRRDTTLAEMKGWVTAAENAESGGVVPLVLHHICNGCDTYSVSQSILEDFLDWLVARGTPVRTMNDALALPPPPPPTGSNLLVNPGFETDANGDLVPDCWERHTYGTLSATGTRVTPGLTGNAAERITVTGHTSGDRKFVQQRDNNNCVTPATPGDRFDMTANHQTTPGASARLVAYRRTNTGNWLWWTQHSPLPTGTTTTTTTWNLPEVPADTTAISVGVSLRSPGTITADDLTLTRAPAA